MLNCWPRCCRWPAGPCTSVIVKASKFPAESKMTTAIPSVNPHKGSDPGQFFGLFTLSSAETLGIGSEIVVCDAVFGMYRIVMASGLKLAVPRVGSGVILPVRRGRIGAKKLISEPFDAP